MISIPGIDAGIRAIKAVEDSWSLPKLPELVTLDLAAFSGLDTLALQSFVGDLENDIQQTMPAPEPTNRTYTLGQQARRIGTGIANMPLPRDVDAGGVQAFKERAVRLGYVRPEMVTMDSSWDPALNNIYWQMSGDDLTRAKQGNVPGPGSSIGEVFETFDKWLAPTGLLEAATELGVFWDFDQIGSEIKGYENPLNHIKDAVANFRAGNFNPIESFKSLWKITGPVDDLLMPIVNVALLFSGVGQVGLFARGVHMGTKGAKALQVAHGVKYAPLTRISPGLGRAAMETTDLVGDIDRMRRGGMLAGRILPNASVLEASGKAVGPTRMAIGRGMQAWRKIPEVMIAKKGVQKGMQLGFVSRVEDKFGINPDPSLSDLPGVRSTTQFMRGYGEPTKFSLPASIMFEALFTPTTIINPGVVRNPFSYMSNFSKVADDAFFSEEANHAIRSHIVNRVEDPTVSPQINSERTAEALQVWDAEVKQVGPTQALANRFTGGDKEELGGFFTWVGITAAIKAQASSVAKMDDATRLLDEFVDTPELFSQKYHTARNSLTSQTRYADPDDLPSALRAIVGADPRVNSIEQADELFRIYMQDFLTSGSVVPGSSGRFGADELREMIDAHNVARRNKIAELLETHMTPGMFSLALESMLDELGDWGDFNKASNLVEDFFNRGDLTRAVSKQGVNPETGRRVGKKETFVRQRTAQGVSTFPFEGPRTMPALEHPIHYLNLPFERSREFPRRQFDYGSPLNTETYGEGSWEGFRTGSVYHGTTSRDLTSFVDPETGELVLKGQYPRAVPGQEAKSVSFTQNPQTSLRYGAPEGLGPDTPGGYIFEVDVRALPDEYRDSPLGVPGSGNNLTLEELQIRFDPDDVNPEVRIPKEQFRVIDSEMDPNFGFWEPEGGFAGDFFTPLEDVPMPSRPRVTDPAHIDLRDVLEDPEFRELAEAGKFNLFGGTKDVRGKMTIARKEMLAKGDKQGEYHGIVTLQRLKQAAGELDTNRELARKWRELLVRLENQFGVSTNNFGGIKEGELTKLLSEIGFTGDAARRIKRLRRYAIKNQVDMLDLESHFAGRLDEIYESDRWARVHGINSDLTPDQKVKALQEQIPYTAAEVDPSSVPEGLIDELDAMGYKLVSGEEFITPRDLDAHGSKAFVEVNDIIEKDKYKDSLGFVGRKWGHRLEAAQARVLRGTRRLGQVGQRYQQDQVTMMYNAQLRNSLVKALWSTEEGHDFSKVDSVDLDQLVERLSKIAKDISKLNEESLGLARDTRGRIGRGLANVQSSFSPESASDLVRTNKITQLMINGVDKRFVGLKGLGYSDDEIVNIIDALKKSRDVGPQLRGRIVSMQDRLQSNPNLTNAMRLLSKTRVVDKNAKFGKRSLQEGTQFATKGLLTVAAGAPVAAIAHNQDDDLSFMHAAGFALLGRSVASSKIGFKAQKAMLKKIPINNSAEIMRNNVGGRGLNNWADKLDNNQKWKHYTYVGDALATMRDYMRFTLSPIFDASRYTEGMVLSQIGHIPESVQQAGGLRMNMSPTRWRRDRARQISGSKKPTPEAIRQADTEWAEIQSEFAGIGRARNDFDFEALEATTARFRQIGILGFNTQDWMSSLYADLTRIHGMDKYKAYETAKKAFTYGLNPRSAAEMNVNAVFFPFSFTKKTFGHAANYLGHDWSRAAMMHDAVKTYEMLDEHYDLHDFWRERMPLLEKAQRLNVFAYGFTPGELGGANRPYINTLEKAGLGEITINPILNLFIPQGHHIQNNAEAEEVFDTLSRIAPVFNDMEHLLQDAREQGHVLFGGNGLTEAAEAERGYAEVSQLNELIDEAIKAKGGEGGISEIRRNRWSRYFDMQQAGKQAIRERYPAYQEAIAASIGNSVLKSQEEKELVAIFRATGGAPRNDSPRDVKLGGLIWLGADLIKRAGSYDQLDPAARDEFREIAASWAEDEPYLRLGWKKHLMRTWGPIESVLG